MSAIGRRGRCASKPGLKRRRPTGESNDPTIIGRRHSPVSWHVDVQTPEHGGGYDRHDTRAGGDEQTACYWMGSAAFVHDDRYLQRSLLCVCCWRARPDSSVRTCIGRCKTTAITCVWRCAMRRKHDSAGRMRIWCRRILQRSCGLRIGYRYSTVSTQRSTPSASSPRETPCSTPCMCVHLRRCSKRPGRSASVGLSRFRHWVRARMPTPNFCAARALPIARSRNAACILAACSLAWCSVRAGRARGCSCVWRAGRCCCCPMPARNACSRSISTMYATRSPHCCKCRACRRRSNWWARAV